MPLLLQSIANIGQPKTKNYPLRSGLILRQARKLGAVQLGFSGGEPMLRKDLVELLREAQRLGFTPNV